jgi:hypothetical protein
MCSTKGSCFYKCKSVISSSPLNQNRTKVFILALSLLSLSFILGSIQSFSKVNAQGSLGQTIQHFNNNLRSGIDKQTQSNLDQGTQQPSANDNSINCNGKNNFVTQSQTTNNGQTTITKSDCNGTASTAPSSIDSQR